MTGKRYTNNNDSLHPTFTPCEASLIRMLAAGLSQKDIASLTNKSYQTVRNEIKMAKTKFGAQTTEHLLVISIALGELPVDELCLIVEDTIVKDSVSSWYC